MRLSFQCPWHRRCESYNSSRSSRGGVSFLRFTASALLSPFSSSHSPTPLHVLQRRREKLEKAGGERSNIPCIAKCLPTHILPPLPNAQNQRLISSFCALLLSIQRSGFHVSGSGNTSALRCRLYACAATRTPPGSGGDPAIDVGMAGVWRGCGPGIAA